jgi:hypothetical protein
MQGGLEALELRPHHSIWINTTIFYIGDIGPQGARSAFSGCCCCSQSEPIFPVSAICLHSIKPRSQIATRHHLCHAEPLHPALKCHFSRAGGFPKVPAPPPPCVFRSPAPFSARSQHTRRPVCVWCFCRPLALFSAIAQHTAPPPLLVPFRSRHCFRKCAPVRLCSTYWV